tara:strand:- start:687 stop:800 length:114 start_codon:yes stop_codon:yes gene_type:complete
MPLFSWIVNKISLPIATYGKEMTIVFKVKADMSAISE